MAKNNIQEADLDKYVPVNERILKFYDDYDDGSLQTEIIKDALYEDDTREVIFKAYAYRYPEDPRPSTGHAHEQWDGEDLEDINAFAIYEVCETSAVGRALANAGYEVKKGVASKEEMEKAQRRDRRNRKDPEKADKAEERAAKRNETIETYKTIKELHSRLGADSDEAKRELMKKSGITKATSDLTVDELKAYVEFLQGELAGQSPKEETPS